MRDEERVLILHATCGQGAFLYRHHPVAGERILQMNAFHLDGRQFMAFERLVVCETCGRRIQSGKDLMPAPPKLRTYDMSSSSDMRKLYEGVNDLNEVC